MNSGISISQEIVLQISSKLGRNRAFLIRNQYTREVKQPLISIVLISFNKI